LHQRLLSCLSKGKLKTGGLLPLAGLPSRSGGYLAMVSRSRFGLLPYLRTLHIEKLLGRGGMGVVWLATERASGRKVALKVMRHDLSEPAAARARFETEIEAARRCAHHHVINLLDDG